jgi:hypothetical protein
MKEISTEELGNLYSALNIIRAITSRMSGMDKPCCTSGKMRNACRILTVKRDPERKKPVRRSGYRRKNNIKVDIKYIG